MKYLENLQTTHPLLAPLLPVVSDAFALLREAVTGGGKILVCGNGGSASDASHIVGELMKGFHLARRLSAQQATCLLDALPAGDAERLVTSLQQAIPAVSLVGETALMTAIANDIGGDFVFAQQVFGLGRAGDALIAISTSGNSCSVVMAAQVAQALGISVVALTGEGGGRLATTCDVAIRAPSHDTATIQEYHLPIYHCLCAMLEEWCFGDRQDGPAPRQTAIDAICLATEIAAVVFDFDGVFTDNKVHTGPDGQEFVTCDRSDSLGLDSLRRAGMDTLILSTETDTVVVARARKLEIPCVSGCRDKVGALVRWMAERGHEPSRIAYVGNDLNDLAAMKLVGWPIAPADAHPAVLAAARLVLGRNGGDGAVRELCDRLLASKENWT